MNRIKHGLPQSPAFHPVHPCSIHFRCLLRLATASLLAFAGCAAKPAIQSPSIDAVARYRQTDDYYALLQVVDEHIDPDWNGRVSKAEVLKYLGKGIDDPDLYPNAGPDFWVYTSTRHVPTGSYLFITFDNDVVKSVAWGSE
jgi:hypothetical protein